MRCKSDTRETVDVVSLLRKAMKDGIYDENLTTNLKRFDKQDKLKLRPRLG